MAGLSSQLNRPMLDLSAVRPQVQGGATANSTSAAAYTQGSAVHLGPGGSGGQSILGHEAAHVLQQGGGSVNDINSAVGHYGR